MPFSDGFFSIETNRDERGLNSRERLAFAFKAAAPGGAGVSPAQTCRVPLGPPADWLDRLLARDLRNQAGRRISRTESSSSGIRNGFATN